MLPIPLIYSIIKLRYVVAERTTVVTERCTTVHATRCLLCRDFRIDWPIHFLVVEDALLYFPPLRKFAVMLHKAIRFSHDYGCLIVTGCEYLLTAALNSAGTNLTNEPMISSVLASKASASLLPVSA